MFNVISRLQCLKTCLSSATISQLNLIVTAILAMTGRVTMLGISRWTGEGGSYRTVQRFFNISIDWKKVQWSLIQKFFLNTSDTFVLAGDETTVTKSGKKTFGLDRFFSSLFGKPVPGLSLFVFSLVSTKWRISLPVMVQQMIRPKEEIDTEKNSGESVKKRGKGRPKGSKNKIKENVDLSPHLKIIQNLLRQVVQLIGNNIHVKYAVFDGAFGHNDALQMVKLGGLDLISKLKKNSKLYFRYEGAYSGKGAHKKYGEQINYKKIPAKFLKKSTCEKSIKTDIYQMTMLHKLFSQQLNIVIIVKENLKTKARDFVILFSSDLDLDYEKLIDYYKLRFQIEFNFRDAKQYWGLEDFMNIKETPVRNAVNLAFFMVNLSHILINDVRPHNAEFSVQDLKAYFRGSKYVDEVLKLLPQKPDPILIQQIFKEITIIGKINTD
ncbi:MAG: transposase [Sulfurisoma sp.]|nr:transposase [Sulfurisoma sp.]